jgi:hypothetical protein
MDARRAETRRRLGSRQPGAAEAAGAQITDFGRCRSRILKVMRITDVCGVTACGVIALVGKNYTLAWVARGRCPLRRRQSRPIKAKWRQLCCAKFSP